MELRGVVIQDKSGCLLIMLRLEFHARPSGETMSLLPACDERLLKLTSQGFSPEQSQETRPFRETPESFGIRCAQPLKVDGQLRRVEILAWPRRWHRMRRQLGRRHADLRHSMAVLGAKPAILRPDHFLDGGLSAKHTASAAGQGPAA